MYVTDALSRVMLFQILSSVLHLLLSGFTKEILLCEQSYLKQCALYKLHTIYLQCALLNFLHKMTTF